MSVMVKVIGADKCSDEYIAALEVKKVIESQMPKNVSGEIILFASATLFGQTVKDIDLLMVGNLNGYKIKCDYSDSKNEIGFGEVSIESFCTAIEIKSHNITGIKLNGTDFYVKYNEGWHCVTEQSNKQKMSVSNFLKRTTGTSPFVTNLIMFVNATSAEISSLLRKNGKEMPSNALGGDFDLNRLFKLIVWQKNIKYINGSLRFNSFEYNPSFSAEIDGIKRAMEIFSEHKSNMGGLTRRKLEQISSELVSGKISLEISDDIDIVRGRAGTGKTIGLISTAVKIVDEEYKRAIILTYNNCLVSDIRRLFALADLPDMFEENCVQVSTIHSFFYKIVNKCYCDSKLKINVFLENYEYFLKEFIEFLKIDIDEVRKMCRNYMDLCWDYILVDEAQDWTMLEKDILITLFNNSKIIVADGGTQFVRMIKPCDWSTVQASNNVKLKYCLRQKKNVVHFINHFIDSIYPQYGKMIPSEKMYGGKIIIVYNDNNLIDIYKNEMNALVEESNIPYDMLCVVPHTLVHKVNGGNEFLFRERFLSNGFKVWDGTNEDNRYTYSIDADESRVVQYDSVRGLEGWTVFCFELDTFIEEKLKIYNPEEKNNCLLLESPADRKNKYILNWALLPMTRAIDTLVITIKNQNSLVGNVLESLANKFPDYITIIK